MGKRAGLIIVGGNAAGMAAALRARRRRPDLDITIIEKSAYIAAATCSLPAFLEDRIAKIQSLVNLSPQEAASQHQLEVLTGHEALEIDPRGHQLTILNLATKQVTKLPYHRLILATGARPIRPNWPNINAGGIFTLRSLDEAQTLRNFLEQRRPRQFVVIGAGTIAQVCASALRSFGMEVRLIGQGDSLMKDLETPIHERIMSILVEGGIDVYFTDNEISLKVSHDNEVVAVDLAGKSFSCQGIMLAMGVEPRVELAKTAGIALSVQGAIRVDRHLMTSRQGIYACGDCAHSIFNLTHRPIYWPLATTASRQGRQAGENASGGQADDPGTLAARLWTCFNLQIAIVGLSSNRAKQQGIKHKITVTKANSKAPSYGGAQLDLVILSDPESGRILGAQMAGLEGIHARLAALSAAIAGRMTLKDLERLDFGFTPEISALWDPIHIAGRLGRRN